MIGDRDDPGWTTDNVLIGLRRLRASASTREDARLIDEAINRIETDDRELAKADRRSAEQEAVIARLRRSS